MNYGFVIDNRKCIGCHACSTACKSENDVPLGVNRTWVKYVETGHYPDATRHFQVTRCNHCANPPCVRICPVTAMYQRDDGIVEFDPEVCIGCKACMQACPYDAIYIDPETSAAAKCHYCAHRVDVGLEPACVVVCPEHAIIAGDMDDPASEISRMLALHKTTVRKPEQGTAPKLFYINGVDVAMRPGAETETSSSYMWADIASGHGDHGYDHGQNGNGNGAVESGRRSASGAKLRSPQPQGRGGHDQPSGRIAGQMVQVAYNAQHQVPWHWPVAAYLVTKAIGAGIVILLGLMWGLNLVPFDQATALAVGLTSLLFIGITTAFLVFDLEKPEMFLTILTRPNWNSWLARGAFILIGFTGVVGVWFGLEVGEYAGFFSLNGWIRAPFLWAGVILGIASAIYTAFLFGQAEGRDLWQSALMPFHLLVQAVMAGAGTVLILNSLLPVSVAVNNMAAIVFAVSMVVDLFVILAGEFAMPHPSDIAARAAHAISHGKYRNWFWQGAIVTGHFVPMVLLGFASMTGFTDLASAASGVAALAGLYCYEYAFVMAPQEIANS